jgi:hypothetical protein
MRINNIYPRGEKCAYKNWLMAAAFAVVAVSFMSFGTHAQAQTPQSPCTKSSAPAPTSTVEIEDPVAGPATMGYFDNRFVYRSFDGGFTNATGAPSMTIVGRAYEALMTEIFGAPTQTVAVNESNVSQSNVGKPCTASSRISGGTIK